VFGRSWLAALDADAGFSAERVLLLPISSNQSGLRLQKPPDFERQLLERVAGLPGVESATAMDPVPLWFGGNTAHYGIEGFDGPQRLGFARVAPGYFETLRLPLLRGRDFTSADTSSAPRVIIVNETFARTYFPGADPIGRTIQDGPSRVQIVGVAKDARYRSLSEEPQPQIYHPLAQEPTDNPSLSLAVRLPRNAIDVRRLIQNEVRALVPAWPQFAFRKLEEGLQFQRLIPRAAATILGALGLCALLLASVGIYGLAAYAAAARTREMAIRLALGAQHRALPALIVRRVLVVCVPGAVAGLVLSFAIARIMAATIVSASSVDIATFVLMPLALVLVATLASYIPARAVVRADPLVSLRAE
jgi:predicted permease